MCPFYVYLLKVKNLVLVLESSNIYINIQQFHIAASPNFILTYLELYMIIFCSRTINDDNLPMFNLMQSFSNHVMADSEFCFSFYKTNSKSTLQAYAIVSSAKL